ncbi:MAG: UbiA-like protein EboC [Salinivenus sp.]
MSPLSIRAHTWAYLQLLRPANIVTALADVLAGAAVAGATLSLRGWAAPFSLSALGALLLSTAGLYGGGVVLNDVFDAPLDADERPERPIPSGRASRSGAALFGALLLGGGVAAAALVGPVSALVAALVAGGAVLYDRWAKHHPVLGPLTMGLCRGGNLLLGVSAVPAAIGPNLYLMALPVAFVGAITSVSQGEVHGGSRRTGLLALVLVAGVLAGLLALSLRPDHRLLPAGPFVALLALQVAPPFVRAARTPSPQLIREAVQAGVVALIPLNAALAAGFAGWLYGLLVLALLLFSMGLSHLFDIT